ncbi:MAG: hypothetical protein HYY64_06975 [Candidatus Rokubacteria bacterium]|nr:hypothetical protein [Candidatus Rokubacteria bacterium]
MRYAILLTSILVAAAVSLPGAIPAQAQNISIGINIGSPPPPPPIVVAAPPQMVVVPGTTVYYAPGISFNYFSHGGQYFTFHDGSWFVAPGYNGPWVFIVKERVPRPVLAVPVSYYKIPPGLMKTGGIPPGHLKKGGGGGPLGAGHGKGPKKWKDD